MTLYDTQCALKVNEQLRDVTYAERWLEGWLSGRLDVDLAATQAQFAAKCVNALACKLKWAFTCQGLLLCEHDVARVQMSCS
jgi:hypothetical protein